MERVLTFITENATLVTGVLAGVLTLLFLFVNVVDRKLSIFSLVLAILGIGGVGGHYFISQTRTIVIAGYDLSIVVTLVLVVFIILMVFIHIRKIKFHQKQQMFFQSVSSTLHPTIYGYLNKRGKVTHLTNVFQVLFATEEGKWEKNIGVFQVGEDALSWNDFLKYVKEADEEIKFKVLPKDQIPEKRSKKDSSETPTLQSLFDECIAIRMIRKEVFVKEKLAGYVLLGPGGATSSKEQSKESTTMANWFDILNEPTMYFDNDKEMYVLSKSMMKLLKQEHTTLSPNSFSGLIVLDDLPVYSKRIANEEKVSKFLYRVKTINGIEWFEESMLKLGNQVYDIIRRARLSNLKYKFLSKTNLIEDIKQMSEVTDKFSLVIVSLNSVLRYNNQGDSDLVEILISKYFNKLNERTLKGKHKIYKLGNIEYAMLFSSTEEYEGLVRDLNHGISDFLQLEVFVNEIRYKMENSVGVVSALAVAEKTPEAIIKAGFDALYLATDPKYQKRFSIYFQSKTLDKNYRFEDIKIDLNDNFDDYL